jgi:signal transduction histidine kinase/ligand-binding sensor domain-containing protein
MQRKLIFLACIIVPMVPIAIGIGSADCLAQPAESRGKYPFIFYTPRDGLINSRVRSIKQDSRGRMLFITFGGLSVYDGTRFINYNRQDGLADDLINDIVEVGPDSFLVATNVAKLNTLVKGKIGVFQTADNFYPVVNRFLKSNDGSWYVTADEGLFTLNGNRFSRIPLLNKGGIDVGSNLDKVIEWKNYFLLIPWSENLGEKLIMYDKATRKVTDIDLKNTVICLTKDAKGDIWAGTGNGPRLIDTIALARGKINFLQVPEKFRDIVNNKQSFIFFDKENNAWFYDKEILKITPNLQHEYITAKQGLEAASLTDMFIDREGTAWIATDGNGIIKIRNTNTELLHSLDQRPISVSTILNQNDTIWLFNAIDRTIYRLADNNFKLFPLREKNYKAINLFVHDQKLYLNAGAKFVCVENKDEPSSYDHLRVIDAINAPNGIGTGVVDRNGAIIQYVNESNNTFYLYVLKDDKLLMKHRVSNFIDQMALDRQGGLWMATRDNQVLKFTLHPDQPSRYLQIDRNYPKNLRDLNPRAITVDVNDNVWIGTRYNGVYRFQCKDGAFKSVAQYTTRTGLTDNFVYTLTCDSNNTIWVGTQTGLDKIFKKNDQYTIGNVSKNNNFFQTVGKIVTTKNNTVWALTNGGIILRTSESLSPAKTSSAPALLFTSLQVNNKPYNDSSKNFSYRQNNLSFTVAATSFIDERSIKYSYLLEGSGNENWSEPSNNPAFNFLNLSPGNYTLKMRSEFPEAMYPSQTINYSFTILPPWWHTWWFFIGISLAILGILFLGIRFYYRRKLEKEKIISERQQAIEKERTRIATDMHDDLGAGLSRIKFLSETIGIKKQRQLPFEEDISKIMEYSHEMIDKMGEIVWALNEKNDSLSDLLSYTRSYTVEYLSQSGIMCSIDSPDVFPMSFVTGEFRRNIFLSVKEILHNIVKHAQANQVTITIQIDPGLCINIIDDGIGFDPAKTRPYSNGLINIKKRMTDIGGIMEIETRNGTMIKLKAPLR